MKTTRTLKMIQRVGNSMVIIMMFFSQLGWQVTNARAMYSNPPVITEGDTVMVPMSANGESPAFNLTLHATDADGDTLTWSIVDPGAEHGDASVDDPNTGNSMAIFYSLTENYTGTDSFVVQVSDGYFTDTITVTVKIGIKIGLATDVGGVDDKSFNQMAYEGLLQAETSLGIDSTLYKSTSADDYQPLLQQCADDGNELCFAVGYLMADAVMAAANANPGTKFAIVDMTVDSPPANLRELIFASGEAAYLAGALAGKMTTTNVVGDIGGMKIPAVTAFTDGFRNGAQCANPDVKVLLDYIGNFTNPEDGAAMAQAMIGKSADVIYAAAGPAGSGAILYSAQDNLWSIGVDVDEYLSTFGNGEMDGSDMLLTSSMKRMDAAVYQTIEDHLYSRFTSGPVLYDLKKGGVGLAPYHETDSSIPQAVKDFIDGLKQDIIDGKIDISQTCRTSDNPFVETAPYSNWIHARGWSLGIEITMTFDDPATELSPDVTLTDTVHQAPWNPGDPNDILADFSWPKGFNPGPGYVITATGAGVTKTLTVADLRVTSADAATDIVSGVATPGAPNLEVCLNRPGTCISRYPSADGETGVWSANYTGEDLQPGDNGWAAEYDADNNRTWYDWKVPSPHFDVRANNDQVEAWEWPLGSTLTLKIYSSGTETDPPDYIISGLVGSSDKGGNYAYFDLNGKFDIQPETLVTVSDGTTMKKTIVTGLAFDVMDKEADTVSGFAEADSKVEIWACDDKDCIHRHLTADGDGKWIADWSKEGPQDDEKNTFDLVGGTWVDSYQGDEDGDGTMFGQNIPNPHFDVRANNDQIEAWDWPLGSTLTVKVYSSGNEADPPDYIISGLVGSSDKGGNYAYFDLNGKFDIQPETLVTVSDATTMKKTIVTGLAFDVMDKEADTVSGFAEAGSKVDTWACDNSGNCINRHVSAGGDGKWIADWSKAGPQDDEKNTFDLVPGTWVDSRQYDDDGDSTMFGQNIPNPRFDAWYKTGEFNAYDWPLGTTLTLDIDDPGTEKNPDYSTTTTVVDNQKNTLGQFHLNGAFDIQPGMTITISGAGITKDLVVSDHLEVTNIDPEADVISGTAGPNQWLWIYINEDSSKCCRWFQADGDGLWTVDYSKVGPNDEPIVDLQPGWSGNLNAPDADGDNTCINWRIPNPNIDARANVDQVETWEWPLGSTLTLKVYSSGTETGSPDYTTSGEVTGPAPWGDSRNYLSFDLGGIYDIQPGNLVTVSGEGTTKKTIVTGLAFDVMDINADTVSGFAAAGSSVDTWACDNKGCTNRHVSADGDGKWIADWSKWGTQDDEHNTFDLVAGTWVDSAQYDEDGDSTKYGLNIPSNRAPVADAGPDQTVLEGATVTLDASASSDPDGDLLTYAWDLDGDGIYDDATGVKPEVTFPGHGVYTVGLKVTDPDGLTGTDTIEITVTACYSLTTGVNPASSGSVGTSPAPTCPGGKYSVGTAVQLTATPGTGYGFTSWSGDASGTTNPVSVTMSAARSVTANFTLNTYLLSVSKTGNGSGTVTSNPAGINCGSTCSYSFNYNTVVTLTAAPSTGSTFTGWSSPCTGTGTCSVTMTAARSVTANFTLKTYLLSVSKTGTGSGTVSSNPTGINCGSTCSYSYNYNTSVTLTAVADRGSTPSKGSTFAGWSGACSGTGTCTVTMSAAKSVTATFTLITFPLTVSKNGAGSGMVISSPVGINCGATCSYLFTGDTLVVLTATPNSHSYFTGWSGHGSCPGTGPCTIMMDHAFMLTANFIIPPAPGSFNKSSPVDHSTAPANPTLSWRPSSYAASYEYRLCPPTGCTGSNYWVSTGSATSIALSGLQPGIHYYWQVRAWNGTGTTYANGNETAYWSFSVSSSPGAFNKISPVNGATEQPNNPTLTWGTSYGATYQYCLSTAACTGSSTWISTGTATSKALSGLTLGTRYFWQVRAASAYGHVYANGTTASWTFTVSRKPGIFYKISPVNGAADQPNDPTLRWGASSTTKSYEYCLSTTACTTSSTWVSTRTATSVTLSGLIPGTTYYWQVRAVNDPKHPFIYADGPTASWTFTVTLKPGAFNKISPANGATNQPTNPTLSWGASSTAADYDYCFSTTSCNESNTSRWNHTFPHGATSVTLKNLTPGTTYTWQVRAVNAYGVTYANGSLAESWSFTVPPLPGAFSKTSPVNGAADQSLTPTLSWGPSTAVASYEYCYDTTNDSLCSGTWTSTGAATSIALSGLSRYTTYYWQVRAVNAVGNTVANAGTWWSFRTIPITASYQSVGAYDGWVLESTSSSGIGGSVDATSQVLRVGDDAYNKQYRSILSFDTSSLPDTAVITQVLVKVMQQSIVGANPFTILGGLNVDIAKPYFGTTVGLEKTDFQVAASKPGVGTFGATPSGGWYTAILGSTANSFVNRTGTTQFRLLFATDSNNNNAADYIQLWSGDATTTANRPLLFVKYYVP